MHVVIIGAGQAASQVVMGLRQNDNNCKITLIGDEADLPYQRPPLSKKFLSGEMEKERLYFKPPNFYTEAEIDVKLNCHVTRIDRDNKKIFYGPAESIAYDKLVLATGSRPRKLPIPNIDLDGIYDLRSIADIEAIRAEATPGKKLIIVGGGYIGLETAASCKALGLDVTILEATTRVLERVADPDMSAYFTQLHEAHGIIIKTSVQIGGFRSTADGARVNGIILKDGSEMDADFIIMGVGIVPNIELAEDAGLEVENGIVVDENGMTSDPDIFAAGDNTNHPNNLLGRRLRLESVPNAIEQAKAVTSQLLGQTNPYHQIPWFWSDQYDTKLQIVGLADGADKVYLRGNMAENSFARFHFKGQQLIAVEAVNRTAEFMASRQLVPLAAQGKIIDPEMLVDPEIAPKQWLKPVA
jgi:3-phenylpropionate/trans-cinnamate dioxygenase ferredoxin reductase subunit